MNTPRFHILALLAILLLPPHALAQSINVHAALASDRVFVGDDIEYQIIIENSRDVAHPQLTAPPGLSIDYSGASDQPAPTMIVNGRRMDTGPDRYILIYRVSASAPGTYTIPSQTIRVAGQDRTLAPVSLTVTLPPEDSSSILEATLSAESAYVGEPITLTLSWLFASDARGVRFTTAAPDAQPPAAPSTTLPYDILPAPDPRPGGARPNDPRYADLTFDGNPIVCTVGRTLRAGREYGIVTATRTIIPTQPGPIEIGPFAAVAQVKTGERNIGILMTQDIIERRISRSQPVTLNVRPLPTQGRPANFTGLVGQFSIDASAQPTQVSVGDPIDLRVRITGPEPLDRLLAPDLARDPAFAGPFRLSADGLRLDSSQNSGSRTYSTTLRATSDRVTRVPPVELAYFDTRAGEYRVARSQPIPLTVRPTRQVTAGDAITVPHADSSSASRRAPTSLPLPPPIAQEPILSSAPGLRANSTSLAALRNQHADLRTLLVQPTWAAGLILPPLTFAAAAVYALARRATPTPSHRKREASRRALALLRARRPSVATALRTYISARFDAPVAGVTSHDARHLLVSEPEPLRDAFTSLIDRADGARLADATAPEPREAIDLLRRLDKEGTP